VGALHDQLTGQRHHPRRFRPRVLQRNRSICRSINVIALPL
jgi:hypothetical protein